jgi:transposase
MPGKRVKRTAEYKLEALRRIVDGKEKISSVADSLGLPRETLYRWVREYRAKPTEAFRGNGKLTSQDEEIRELRRKVARLEEEREILKKPPPSLRESHAEVRIHRGEPNGLPGYHDVFGTGSKEGWILCVAQAATECSGSARRRTSRQGCRNSRRKSETIRSSARSRQAA